MVTSTVNHGPNAPPFLLINCELLFIGFISLGVNRILVWVSLLLVVVVILVGGLSIRVGYYDCLLRVIGCSKRRIY